MGIHKFLTSLKKLNDPTKFNKNNQNNNNNNNQNNKNQNNKFIINKIEKKYDYILIDCFSLFYNSKNVIELFNKFIKNIDNHNNINEQQQFNKEYQFNLLTFKNLIKNYEKNYENNLSNDDKLCNIINNNKNDDFLYILINSFLKNINKHNFNVENFILDDVYNNIIDIINNNKKDDNTKIIIFFDNIPSIAKIQEQINRQIYNLVDIMIQINREHYKDDIIENNIIDNIIIKPGEEIITELINKINEMNKINNLKIETDYSKNKGEAEHEIYYYIINNIYNINIKNKNILFVSPDSDVIILSLILYNNNLNKNNNIDVLNVSCYKTFREFDEYNKYFEIDTLRINRNNFLYIDINNLEKYILNRGNLNILDICFLSIFLGNDFLPKMYFLYNFDKLIDLYNEFKNEFNNNDIINHNNNNYNINIDNFKIFIKYIGFDKYNKFNKTYESNNISNNIFNIINKNIIDQEQKNNKIINNNYVDIYLNKKLINLNIYLVNKVINITNIVDFYNDFKKIKFPNKIEIERLKDHIYKIKNIDKYNLLKDNNIIIYVEKKNNDYILVIKNLTRRLLNDIYLFEKNKNLIHVIMNEVKIKEIYDIDNFNKNDIIKNYLDGIKFIFHLYFNNKIIDQNYYYKYKFTPTLYEIYTYLNNNNYDFNDYNGDGNIKLKNIEQNKKYIELKLGAIKQYIAKRIHNKYYKDIFDKGNITKYFQYEFLDTIIYSIDNYLDKSVIYNLNFSDYNDKVKDGGSINNDYYNIINYIIKYFTKNK